MTGQGTFASADATSHGTGAAARSMRNGGHNEDGRGEGPLQRADRNMLELLQELRVAQTGVQILFAFLLSLAFTERFASIDATQRWTYVVTLLLSVVTAGLLVAPAAVHRVTFRRGLKAETVQAGHRLFTAGLATLAFTLIGAVLLVLDVAIGRAFAMPAAMGVAAVLLGLWFVLPLPLLRRARAEDDEGEGPPPGDRDGEGPSPTARGTAAGVRLTHGSPGPTRARAPVSSWLCCVPTEGWRVLDGLGRGDPATGSLHAGGLRLHAGGPGASLLRATLGLRTGLRAAVDVPTPAAFLAATGLDELLEVLEVALHPVLDDPQRVARLLDEPLGLVVELERHAGRGVVEPVKGHHTGLVGAVLGLPGHPLVRMLLGDLGVELTRRHRRSG